MKSELIVQFKALQKDYDTLKHENEKNLGTIKNLEEKVSLLMKPSTCIRSKGSQTFSKEIQICCNVCIYVATCEEELNWHMGYEHDLSEDSYFDKDFYCEICSRWFDAESDMKKHMEEHQMAQQKAMTKDNDKLYCNFCECEFFTKRELMTHKKKVHTEKVAICWQFASGSCDFGEEYCWFSHCQSRQNLETVMFKCNSCDNKFQFRSDLLKHRKDEHTHLVPPCRNEKNGTCKFGNLKCWFNHTKMQEMNRFKNDEKFDKVNEEELEKVDDEKSNKQNERNKNKISMTHKLV